MDTEDHIEIAGLLARYAHRCDQRDFEGVGECFTEDGQATYSGVRLQRGREHIVAHLAPLANVPMTQHVVGSVLVDVDGDTATARSYTVVHLVRPTADGHEVVHRGLSYDDTLVRTTDGWRFHERFHQVLWSTTEPTEWPVPTFKG